MCDSLPLPCACASVRILGGHALGLQMNPPKVSAELHKEQDVVGAMHNHGKQGMCTVRHTTTTASRECARYVTPKLLQVRQKPVRMQCVQTVTWYYDLMQ